MSTLMDTQVRLTSEQSPQSAAEFAAMHDVPYHEAVGAVTGVDPIMIRQSLSTELVTATL